MSNECIEVHSELPLCVIAGQAVALNYPSAIQESQ